MPLPPPPCPRSTPLLQKIARVEGLQYCRTPTHTPPIFAQRRCSHVQTQPLSLPPFWMAYATLKKQYLKNKIGPKDLWENKVCFMAIPWKWTPAYPSFITYKLIYFFCNEWAAWFGFSVRFIHVVVSVCYFWSDLKGFLTFPHLNNRKAGSCRRQFGDVWAACCCSSSLQNLFIFAAGPTGSGVGANFLMKTGGQEKRPHSEPCSKKQGK